MATERLSLECVIHFLALKRLSTFREVVLLGLLGWLLGLGAIDLRLLVQDTGALGCLMELLGVSADQVLRLSLDIDQVRWLLVADVACLR